MKTSVNAKTRLLTRRLLQLAWLGIAIPASGSTIKPHFDCGMYQVSGRLRHSGRQDFVLTVRAGTSSPYELILLGGNISDKLEHVDTRVSAEIYVPHPIHDNLKPFVFFQKFVSPPPG